MIKVIFVILNYKSFQDTIKVADEILSMEQDSFHIVVVDNASPNKSFASLYDYYKGNNKVDVISSGENGGYAKGNNYGLRYAKRYNPEFACVINNDVHFSLSTIQNLIQIYGLLTNPAFISPVQKLPDGTIASFSKLDYPSFVADFRSYTFLFQPPRHIYSSNTKFDNVQKVWYVPGAFLFIRYSVFEKIGFFDESTFLYGEENFTACRVRKHGLQNYIILDEFYLHDHSKTIRSEKSEYQQYKMIFDAKLLFTKKCRSFPLLKTFMLWTQFNIHSLELFVFKKLRVVLGGKT